DRPTIRRDHLAARPCEGEASVTPGKACDASLGSDARRDLPPDAGRPRRRHARPEQGAEPGAALGHDRAHERQGANDAT
ncbi:MAG: hypothetical protein AVDCRST_MAG19-3412, partial [uncultured Thermomicrobiales bacterium]